MADATGSARTATGISPQRHTLGRRPAILLACARASLPEQVTLNQMKKALSDQIANNPTQFNIEAIAKLEHEALYGRTPTERASDTIVKFIGSLTFLLLHALLVAAWTLINLNVIPGIKPFDPFPFGILALVVSSESVFLTIFVLISQNRMARQAERRSHLDLQVSMLAEQEITMMLQMQQKLCQHLGVDVQSATAAVEGFSRTTDVHKLATELEKKLPGQ